MRDEDCCHGPAGGERAKKYPEREHTVSLVTPTSYGQGGEEILQGKGRQCLPSVSCLVSVTHHNYAHEKHLLCDILSSARFTNILQKKCF